MGWMGGGTFEKSEETLKKREGEGTFSRGRGHLGRDLYGVRQAHRDQERAVKPRDSKHTDSESELSSACLRDKKN